MPTLHSVASVLLALGSPAVLAADACSLLKHADVEELLGQPVSSLPAGPDYESAFGGQLTYCVYRTPTNAAATVSVVQYPSAVEARRHANAEEIRSLVDASNVTVISEGGIGELSFWGRSSKGVFYTFLKQRSIVRLAIGGPGLPNAETRKDRLRGAALALALKF